MYTSGRTVKSKASKPAGLTVAKATAQARRIASAIMPQAGVTVESKNSHDLDADIPTIVTTVTFPAGHEERLMLAANLITLPDYIEHSVDLSPSRIAITRKR